MKSGIGVAHDAGKPTTAHVYPKEAIVRIINAGIDCVELGVMMDDECIDIFLCQNGSIPTTSHLKVSGSSEGSNYGLFDPYPLRFKYT